MPAEDPDGYVGADLPSQKVALAIMEAHQDASRPVAEGFALVDMWNQVAAEGRLDDPGLSRTSDPDKAVLQLKQCCGELHGEGLEWGILYTDRVSHLSGHVTVGVSWPLHGSHIAMHAKTSYHSLLLSCDGSNRQAILCVFCADTLCTAQRTASCRCM